MADLQKQFVTFNDTIAVDYEKKTLADKREKLLKRLSKEIANQRKKGKFVAAYSHRNQGSYAMHTGIKPLDDDYDLDVALIFEIDKNDHPDPLEVKRWVYDALDGHTKEVRVREPCVTVFYHSGGEPLFHMDFAIYAKEVEGPTYLARGKIGSSKDHRVWEESDPKTLLDIIEGHFTDENERAQFRRAIRCLKRWKDVNFSSQGHEAPTGIALTACAYRWFTPISRTDRLANTRSDDDMESLRQMITVLLARFDGSRLSVALPTPPGNDLFERMNDSQMAHVKNKLVNFRDALQSARSEADPHEAAKIIKSVLGDDFPVPDKKETGVKRTAAIVSSGHSA